MTNGLTVLTVWAICCAKRYSVVARRPNPQGDITKYHSPALSQNDKQGGSPCGIVVVRGKRHLKRMFLAFVGEKRKD